MIIPEFTFIAPDVGVDIAGGEYPGEYFVTFAGEDEDENEIHMTLWGNVEQLQDLFNLVLESIAEEEGKNGHSD